MGAEGRGITRRPGELGARRRSAYFPCDRHQFQPHWIRLGCSSSGEAYGSEESFHCKAHPFRYGRWLSMERHPPITRNGWAYGLQFLDDQRRLGGSPRLATVRILSMDGYPRMGINSRPCMDVHIYWKRPSIRPQRQRRHFENEFSIVSMLNTSSKV